MRCVGRPREARNGDDDLVLTVTSVVIARPRLLPTDGEPLFGITARRIRGRIVGWQPNDCWSLWLGVWCLQSEGFGSSPLTALREL